MTPDDPFANPERPVVRMVGSSTEQDLHKDTMVVTALQDMAAAPAGLLIWLNHDYTVPDSLFGSLIDQPSIIHKGGFADLHLAVEVELENPAAAKTFRYIQKKRRLGCSVGCSVDDYEVHEDPKDGTPRLHITHVRPVEWSVVGVPANQRSWVENAARGIFENALKGYRAVEHAERLAPIVKGLFPREYNKIVGLLDDGALRKSLQAVTPRYTPAQRILWEPETQRFFIAAGSERRLWSEVLRDQTDLEAIRAKAFEGITIKDASANEAISGTTTTTVINLGDNVTSVPPISTTTTGGTVTYTYPITYPATTMPAITPQIVITLPVSEDEIMKQKATTKDIVDTENGEALVRQDLEDKSEGKGDGKGDAAKAAQQARSHKYGIGVKAGGNVTKPGEWSSVPDSEWGDPVNYRYPMPDKTHADNAASRWGDASNRSQYSSEEQAIIGRRIKARQSHFGESGEKEKSVKNIVSQEVQEDGALVIVYDDGEQILRRSVLAEDGITEHIDVVLKAADEPEAPAEAESPAETDEPEVPAEAVDAPAAEVDAAVDADELETKAAAKKPAADADGDDDGDAEDDNDDDGDGDGKGKGKKKKPADGKDEEDSDGESGDDKRFVGPPMKEDKKEGKGKAKPKGEKEDYAAPTADETDPQRVALLASYNGIGAILGFEQRSLGVALTKAAEAGDTDQLKSLAMVIDDAADQLLRALGVEDANDEQFEKSVEGDETFKLASGAEISSRNVKKIAMIHDMVADFSGGMHCAAYVKRVSDAPAQMATEEQKDGDDAVETAETAIPHYLEPEVFENLAEQMGQIAKGLENLSALKTAQTEANGELETLRNEVVLARKALGDLHAESQELQASLNLYGGVPTGRPTRKDGREVPTGRALGVGENANDDPGDETPAVPEPKTLDEAMKLTSVEYLPGVGRVRRWPAGVGKGMRPSLETDQMACMTTVQMLAYYNGEEARVPVLN